MEGPPSELTDIQRFYKNGTVFLTGATGFVGKLFLEKVLRALPVRKVYILVRSKRDVPAQKRFENIFESPAFDPLKRSNPNALKLVQIMEGDCSLPHLGLNDADRATFRSEVDVIFHCAASVRFEEHIKKSTLTNVRGTRDLIELAKQTEKLKTFIYVGTAFSNSNRKEIKEEIYPSKFTAEQLIAACESLDDRSLDSVTKTLIGDWPNTYTFTKQITEEYIGRECRGIPICIARPSIVISTSEEPVAGFVDNVYTLAGFTLSIALGVARIVYYKPIKLDIVPVDYVINECIAAGWQTGETFKAFKTEIPVYNISTVQDNPISQDDIYAYCHYNAEQIPTEKIVMYPMYFRTTCKYNYLFWRTILHTFIASIFDLLGSFKGQKPLFGPAIQKLHKFQESYEHFTTNQFYHHVENSHRLLKKMSFKDREIFKFNVTTINWSTYFNHFIRGLRVYIVKDPMSTVAKGLRHLRFLKYAFYAGLAFIIVVIYFGAKLLVFNVVPAVFGVVLYALRAAVC